MAMPTDILDRSMSSLSITSSDSQPEDDWDRSLILESDTSLATRVSPDATVSQLSSTTPRNSIVFPAEDTPSRTTRYNSRDGSGMHSKNGSVDGRGVGNDKKRTLSELLRLHSERGSNGEFSAEEALRIADVLGQWINASSSPYEGEDDFFSRHAQDDIKINASAAAARRVSDMQAEFAGRPRGRSESANSNANSRPPSALGPTPA